jgi:hypothetical protein
MPLTRSAMRTPLCVAFARRTLTGMAVATVGVSTVWAASSSRDAKGALLAPVETAQIKLVPSRVVRVEPPPLELRTPLQTPPPATDNGVPTVAPGEREWVLEQFARGAPAAKRSIAKTARSPATAVSPAAAPSVARKSVTPKSAAERMQAPADTVVAAAPMTAPPTAPTMPRSATGASPGRDDDGLSSAASAALARVMQTSDNHGAPFVIIDKRKAHLWLFDGQGQARGHSPVLLGLARGDHTVPGIGDKPLEKIKPGERTTPAGRFVAEAGRNARGDDIFWIDYDAAVSMHRVHDVDRGENRLQRLATPTAADNRISYGCINVPIAFYDQTLLPVIGRTRPVVYLLPETRPVETLFTPHDKLMAGRTQAGGKSTSWRQPTSAVSGSSSRSGAS